MTPNTQTPPQSALLGEVTDTIPRAVLTLAVHRLRSVANGNAQPALAGVAADDLLAALLASAAAQSRISSTGGAESADKLDAERYRRIRNGPHSERHGDLYAMTFQGEGDHPVAGEELDRFVDAAIKDSANLAVDTSGGVGVGK